MAKAHTINPGVREDEAKAREAFMLQVENGDVEIWLRETWTDAWLRGFYRAKAERLTLTDRGRS